MGVSVGIPQSWLLPLFWGVVDGSQAGNLTESQPALLIGQAFLGGDATSAAKAGIVGNGTLTLDNVNPVLAGASVTTPSTPYKVVFTSATAFNVTQNGVTIGTGTVGTAFANQIKFLIAAGATAFAVNDEFDITVAALPSGNAAYNVPIPAGSLALAKLFFGEGSMLERMVNTFLQGNTTQQMWCVAVPRPAAGIKATGSIQIASQQSGSGVLTVYIAGQKIQVTVYQTDTQAMVAANLVAAINAMTTLPVVAAVDGTVSSKVDLICRWHGLTGNDITIVPNYLAAYGGEILPVGMTLAVVPMTGGAGTPDFTAAISAIQSKQFYHFAMPYSDTASLQVWDAEVGFGPTGRWAYTRQQYGWIYNFRRDTYANLLVWGLAQNSPVISTGSLEAAAPTSVWEFTAGYCAQGAAALLDDPARPLQTLELPGCLPATVDPAVQPVAAQQPRELGSCRLWCRPFRQPDDPARADAVPAQPVWAGRHGIRSPHGAVEPRRASKPDEVGHHVEVSTSEACTGRHTLRARPGDRHAEDHQGRTRVRGSPSRVRRADVERAALHQQPHRRDRRQ